MRATIISLFTLFSVPALADQTQSTIVAFSKDAHVAVVRNVRNGVYLSFSHCQLEDSVLDMTMAQAEVELTRKNGGITCFRKSPETMIMSELDEENFENAFKEQLELAFRRSVEHGPWSSDLTSGVDLIGGAMIAPLALSLRFSLYLQMHMYVDPALNLKPNARQLRIVRFADVIGLVTLGVMAAVHGYTYYNYTLREGAIESLWSEAVHSGAGGAAVSDETIKLIGEDPGRLIDILFDGLRNTARLGQMS